jgi:hypothetical protein
MISPERALDMAKTHCEDLLREAREARQAALAAKANGATGGWWDRTLRLAAHLLLKSGHRLNAYRGHRRPSRTAVASHYAPYAVYSRHQPNTSLCYAGSHGVAARCAIEPGPSGGHPHA